MDYNERSQENKEIQDTSPNFNETNKNFSITKKLLYGKRKYIILLSLIILFIGIFSVNDYQNYKNALTKLETIDEQITEYNYNQAFNDTNIFKTKYKSKTLQLKADNLLKQLVDKSDQQFNEGIKILKNDDIENFEITERYFNDYKVDFNFNSHQSSVDDILFLINSLKNDKKNYQNQVLLEASMIKKQKVIEYMDSFVKEGIKVHDLAEKAANNDITAKIELIDLWSTNSREYRKLIESINAPNSDNVDSTVITKDEFEDFKSFMLVAFCSGENVYNHIVYEAPFPQDSQEVWGEYNILKPSIEYIIEDNKGTLSAFHASKADLEDSMYKLTEKIKSYGTIVGID